MGTTSGTTMLLAGIVTGVDDTTGTAVLLSTGTTTEGDGTTTEVDGTTTEADGVRDPGTNGAGMNLDASRGATSSGCFGRCSP